MKMSSSIKNDGDVKKFLFDNNDFDAVATDNMPVAESYTAEQMELARSQSYAQGKADGLRDAKMSTEELQQRALHNIALSADTLVANEERREIETMTNTARLALKVTHKLLPRFAQRYSLQEIEHVILTAVDTRRDEARIAITVNGGHLEALKHHIEELAAAKGFGGKLIIIADDNLAPTDVRVEWADGGAERLYERLYAQIESEFAKAIAGMQSTMTDDK